MSIIMGALAGGGEALEKSGLKAQEQLGQRELLNLKLQADRELQASMQEFHRGENALGRQLTRDESAAGRDHATNLQRSMQTFTQGENALNRDLQTELARMRESGDDRRHSASIGVQMAQLKAMNEQVILVPQDDGTILKQSKDGQSLGFVSHPVTGEPIKGKGISDATKILMQGNEAVIKGLEIQAAKTETSPEERANLQKKIEAYTNENKRLAGMKVDAPAAKAGAQWDNSSGDVMLDGKKIGTAKTQQEAVALVQKARSAPAKEAAPKAVPKPKGIVTRGIGEVLDAADPRQQPRVMTEEERERERETMSRQSPEG